jgi:hypothetical protein
MTAELEIVGDSLVLHGFSVGRGAVNDSVEIDVAGVDEFTVPARTEGPCGSVSTGYAALVQAYRE